MKKLLIISLFLVACDTRIATKDALFIKPVVYKIENFGSSIYCEYYINTYTDYVYYDDDIIIVDTIGKFSIGDTVNIITIKN